MRDPSSAIECVGKRLNAPVQMRSVTLLHRDEQMRLVTPRHMPSDSVLQARSEIEIFFDHEFDRAGFRYVVGCLEYNIQHNLTQTDLRNASNQLEGDNVREAVLAAK